MNGIQENVPLQCTCARAAGRAVLLSTFVGYSPRVSRVEWLLLPRLDCAPVHAMAQAKEESVASQMAVELKRNRELTTKLYVLRGDALPNDHR